LRQQGADWSEWMPHLQDDQHSGCATVPSFVDLEMKNKTLKENNTQ
jgi:hypothetical protein